MANPQKDKVDYSEKQTARRRDKALKRALGMKPKPRDAEKSSQDQSKRRRVQKHEKTLSKGRKQ